MKPIYKAALAVFLFVFVFNSASVAQLNEYSYKAGLQFHMLLMDGDFSHDEGYKFSPMVRAFGRYELSPKFDLEAGLGVGLLRGKDRIKDYYEIRVIPVDARVLFSPIQDERFNPYIYLGLGLTHFDVTNKPQSVNKVKSLRKFKPTKSYGWTVSVPFGIGTEIAVSESFLADVSLGYTYNFQDRMDYYNNYKFDEKITNNDGYLNFGVGLAYSHSANKDVDNDGLLNSEEKALGTDPKNPDTDGDGVSDGDEVNKYKTNPLKADTDGDGLSDYAEVTTYKTDPNKADTDADGINDYDEVMTYKTNPNKADSDGEGLNDYDEIFKYKTNANKADSDSDGLSDLEEVKLGTNPLVADSDGDGLTDGDEVNKYKTNPLAADTDKGTVNDGAEVKRGTDPLNPKDDIILEMKDNKVVLEGITFNSGKAVILPESEDVLNKALNTLNAYPNLKVEIRGYTDSRGSRAFNNKLSKNRAQSVVDWLTAKGVDKSRLTAKGFGPLEPLASNDTEEGRAQNRRIEFVVTK